MDEKRFATLEPVDEAVGAKAWRNPLRATAVALILILGLSGCGTNASSTDTSADPTQSEAAGDATVTPSSPAPAASTRPTEPAVVKELRFTAKTVEGDAFDGTTLAGEDAVLWFWAPWCTECRREAPYVAKSQAKHPGVTFLGVAGLGETDDMRAFVDDYEVGAFEHLADLDGSLWQRFGVVRQPAYAFIDESGEIELYRGELGEDGLAERVGALSDN